MAAVETGAPRAHGKGQKKHKKKRRLNIRIDMTPMVDVAFLLLTFFMLTTYFSKPHTMELNLPPDTKTTVEVAESNLLTIRVGSDETIYWSIGSEVPKKIKFSELRAMLIEKSKSNPKLITLLKLDRDGKYNTMVNLMDELNLANITRFSIAPMADADKKMMQKAA